MHIGGLRPLLGWGCLIASLFTKFPDMLGCQIKGELLCFKQNLLCFKVGDEKDENEKCVVNQAKCTIIRPTVLLKGIAQVFCLDTRCSLPLDKDMPCLFNVFGFTCCYKAESPEQTQQGCCGGCSFPLTCCQTVQEMEHVAAPNSTKYQTVDNTKQ